MPRYDIPLVLVTEAPTYEDALISADEWARGIQPDVGVEDELFMPRDLEHDNDGQRVLYLHSEDATSEYATDYNLAEAEDH